MREPLIRPYKGIWPKIDPSAFIAETAVIIGDVEIGPESSIWYGTVLRGDVMPIRVGARSNVQDNSMVHVTSGLQATEIGDDVLVGHMCIIHGCTLESGAFVGMGSTVLDEAVVEGGAMLGANSLLTARKRVPGGQLWGGNPAKMLREVSPEMTKGLGVGTDHYVDVSRQYLSEKY